MEVHSPFHYSHHHQPRFYEPRTAPYPHYQTRLDSPYVREAPPAPSYHHRRGPSYGGSSSPRQAEPIKLPGISDLLNYSRDSDRQSSMQRSQPQPRPEPTWPRSVAPAPSLKVETSNIDPRLHKPASPPHPGNASIDSRTSPLMPAARQSPAYSHSVGPASAYPSSAFSEDANQSKRLSLQSAQSAVSSRSSASGGYPSPETAKSGISMYPPVPPRRQSPGGLVNQRPLPQDFPGPQAARAPSPPRQHTHVAHPAPTVPQPMYIDTRPAAQSHPYHVSPTMSHQVQQTPTSAPQTPASSTSMAAVPNSAPQLQDRYVCPSCSKAFSRPSSLRIHSHSHTGEKPFKCTRKGCGKAFSVRSNMKRHERGCHIDGSGPGDSSPRSMSGEA